MSTAAHRIRPARRGAPTPKKVLQSDHQRAWGARDQTHRGDLIVRIRSLVLAFALASLAAAPSGFNANELAEGFAAAGRTLVVQACRVSRGAGAERLRVLRRALPRG